MMTPAAQRAELQRLTAARDAQEPWRKWGPYLSERQWGTVREDYSESGDAWNFFTHDQARSRAYRWGEDGLAGISDDRQLLCFSLALWNGKDAILKERLFGLTNSEGNHGEDVKEYYFYLDSTPTHSYMKYLYKYPQAAFPYAEIIRTNRERGRQALEYELLDTGVFDQDRYFDVFVEYAKASAEDVLIRITVHNRGPENATLHVLPTLWFRNTWSWDDNSARPSIRQIDAGSIAAVHPDLGERFFHAEGAPEWLFTENETNFERFHAGSNRTPFVKDGINNRVVYGGQAAVNPDKTGTKASAYYRLTVPAGGSQMVRLRLSDVASTSDREAAIRAEDFDRIVDDRLREADEFYAGVIPSLLTADQKNVMRQALAGMLWSKQFYNYDVDRWLSERGSDPFKPTTPNRILAATWRGVVGRRMFAEAQFSQKNWKLENAGGTSAAIVDSPFLTRGVSGIPANLQYNGPYFDSTDPEERNNQQFTASVSEIFSSRRLGTHELKSGFESFTSTRVGGNSQSLSGYVFQTDYKVGTDGRPQLDANGRLIPRFVPGTSRLQTWMPLRGSSIDVTTTSAYVNDHWTAGSRFTFDVGVRYERARSTATGNISGADGSTVVPRLGAAYDLTADGRTVVHATYGHYAGKYNDVQFSRNSNVGNADRITGTYIGPAGDGRDFAAGFDPANYQTFTGTFPTANVFFADGLESPLTREFTLGLARELRDRGWVRATYVTRHATNFVEDFITMAEGQTIVSKNGVNLGAFDNAVYRNTNLPTRDYGALQFESAYRPIGNLSINGHWTVQLKNDGTFEGESSSGPAQPSLIADYPEIYVPARNFPTGRLDDFQRNKVRVWATYQVALGRFGAVDVAPLYRYNSGRTYSLVASGVPLSAQQIARNPGYARLPTSQSIFFGERGSQSFEGFHLVDLAATYSVPVWQSLRPWVKLEILNAFNNLKLVSWNTSITADASGPKEENGLPINYVKSATFGTAAGPSSYPRPRPGLDGGRTLLLAAGLRF